MERQRRSSAQEAQTRLVLEIFENARIITLGLKKPKRINKKKQKAALLQTLEESPF